MRLRARSRGVHPGRRSSARTTSRGSRRENTAEQPSLRGLAGLPQRRVRHPAVACRPTAGDLDRGGTVNPDSGLDHYFAAVDQSPPKSDRIGVSYYRTERVPNEDGNVLAPATRAAFAPGADRRGVGEGNSDYVLAGGTGGDTPYASASLSPVFPPPDGVQAGFNGDYSGLTINRGTTRIRSGPTRATPTRSRRPTASSTTRTSSPTTSACPNGKGEDEARARSAN